MSRLARAAAVTALVVGAGLGGGAAVAVVQPAAAAPSTLTACVQKGSNLMRLVTGAGRHCNRNETQVTWNVVGPQGPQGDQGLVGPKGDQGDPGAPGSSVTVATEPAGEHCAAGGAALTDADGTVYVCNGAAG